MGSGPSKPEIDLLPPKIKRDEGPLDRAHETPFEHSFGIAQVQRIVYDFADRDPRVRCTLRPGLSADQAVSVDVKPFAPIRDAALVAKHFAMDATPWQATFGAKSDRIGGQLAAFVNQQWLMYAAGSLDFAAPSATAADNTNTARQRAEAAAKGSAFPFISSTNGAGFRFFDTKQRFSFGGSVSQASLPFQAWGLLNVTPTLSFGVRGLSSVERPVPALDFGVSFHVKDHHEISFVHSTALNEFAFRFFSQNTLRRRIHNPFEEGHIKGIYNYLDVAVELKKQLYNDVPPTVVIGSSWQVNKNVALKLRAGTDGAAGSVVLRSWWDPSLTVGVTGSMAPGEETPRVGLFLGIDQGAEVEYRKALPTRRVQGVSHKALVSLPSTDARDSTTPDHQPFAPVPKGMATKRVRDSVLPPDLVGYGDPATQKHNKQGTIYVPPEELASLDQSAPTYAGRRTSLQFIMAEGRASC